MAALLFLIMLATLTSSANSWCFATRGTKLDYNFVPCASIKDCKNIGNVVENAIVRSVTNGDVVIVLTKNKLLFDECIANKLINLDKYFSKVNNCTRTNILVYRKEHEAPSVYYASLLIFYDFR